MNTTDILINNFNDAAKSIQRYIILSCTISVTLYLLATIKDLKKITVLNLEVDAIPGLTIFFSLYVAAGLTIAFLIYRLHAIFRQITENSIKSSLSLCPTVACGNKAIRISALILPVALFGIAMEEAYDNLLNVLFMVTLFSAPYFIAASHSFNENL